jgi:hypothetical protein
MHGTARAAQPQPPITPLHQAAACRPPPYPCRPVAVLAAGRSVDRRPEFPGPELAGRTAQYSADHACYLSTHLLRASCECGGRPPGPQGWMGSGASASERFSSWLLANRQPAPAPTASIIRARMHACMCDLTLRAPARPPDRATHSHCAACRPALFGCNLLTVDEQLGQRGKKENKSFCLTR